MQQICHFTARSNPSGAERRYLPSAEFQNPGTTQQWHFSLDLARDSDNFPKKVLALFDKHFWLFGAASSSPITTRPFLGPGPAGEHPEQLHHLRHPVWHHV